MNYIVGEKLHMGYYVIPDPKGAPASEAYWRFWTFWRDGECVESMLEADNGHVRIVSLFEAAELMRERWAKDHYESRAFATTATSIDEMDIGSWAYVWGHMSDECPYGLRFSPAAIIKDLMSIAEGLAR